jgi:ribosomal protein S27E
MAALEPGSIDVCVTSPPYNIGAAYWVYEDEGPISDVRQLRPSWETSCADCGEYYRGVFAEPPEVTEIMCPSCGSRHTTGIGSPAGAMSLIFREGF